MGIGLSVPSLVDLHFFCHFEYIQTVSWECSYPPFLKKTLLPFTPVIHKNSFNFRRMHLFLLIFRVLFCHSHRAYPVAGLRNFVYPASVLFILVQAHCSSAAWVIYTNSLEALITLHYHFHETPPVVHIVGQINPVHAITS